MSEQELMRLMLVMAFVPLFLLALFTIVSLVLDWWQQWTWQREMHREMLDQRARPVSMRHLRRGEQR